MINILLPKQLLLLIGVFLIASGFFYWSIWFTSTNIDEYTDKYSKSQYVLGSQSTELISDSELYVYAAHAYLLGEDPTNVNFEHPPLAKYIYGISLRLFENVYFINLILFPLLLVVVYHFSAILIDNIWLRLSVVGLFAFQPIIFSQLQYVLLDVPITIALLLFFIVLHKVWQNPVKKYIFAGILLGVIASIKYPIPFIFIPATIFGIVAWKENKLPLLFAGYIVSGLVYLACYTFYFSNGHTLIDFIAFEKYRFSWWTGDRTIPKFLLFPNLFFGQHKAWWDDSIQYTKEWNILLPTIFLAFIVSLIKVKKEFWVLLLSSFGLGMMLVFGYGAASSLRYLTMLLPFWLTVVFFVFNTFIFKQKVNIVKKRKLLREPS